MSERRDQMLWLREQILARKAAAEAATDGPWEVTGQDGLGDAWQIHGGVDKDGGTVIDWNGGDPVEAPVRHRVATLNYEDGWGVWRREDADHIVLNQPADTIARCEAELRVLDRYEGEDRGRTPDYWHGLWLVVEELAYAYRFQPGWREEWAPEAGDHD